MDFGVGKRLTNLPALRQIGYTANRRLLAVQRLSHDPIAGDSVLRSACDPVIHANGTRIAGLRVTDPRAQALLHILLIFRLHPGGFLNKDLRSLLGEYLGLDPHRFRRHHPKWHDGLRGENRKWDRLARSTPRNIRTRLWSW